MKLHNTILYSIINNTGMVIKSSHKTFTGFCTPHSKRLFTSFLRQDSTKHFHITAKTEKRITNIPVDKIDGSILSELKSEHGIVYFDSGLHFLYAITRTGVYIMTSTCKYRKKVDNPTFLVSQAMDGFLYYDFMSSDATCYINNPLDIFNNEDTYLLKEPETLEIIKRMNKAILKGDHSIKDSYTPDYDAKKANTELCLQAFMFIFFAKVINTTRVSESKSKISLAGRAKRRKLKNIVSVIKVDTFYDETITVINPFNVTGHFRSQPCGKGRIKRKTIYIDSFMKTGYERKATKLKLNR